MLKEQKEYYNRQIKLSNFGESAQKKLLDSKVLIIGAGGLGHPTAQYLNSMGVGNITICDHDKVELSNLHRQVLFNHSDLGKYKAEVVKKKLNSYGPWTQISAISEYLDIDLAQKIIPLHDIIIDCTDNLSTKFLIHDTCYEKSKNLIQASIHKFDGQLQVFQYEHHKDKGCLRCLWSEIPMQQGSCDDNGVLAVVPGMFGIMQASEAIKTLIGNTHWKHNEILTFDLMSFSSQKIGYKKNNDCKFCNNIITKEVRMNDMNLNLKDINPNDYTWLDIRIATAEQKLESKISADQIVVKTDAQIIHEFNNLPSNKPFIVICDRGIRSKNLTEHLREKGYQNVYSLNGGFTGIEE